jgi:hypothetical protein
MRPPRPQLPSAICDLATLIEAAFQGGVAKNVPITDSLARLAIRRHRVGPLVHAASLHSGNADGTAEELLRDNARANGFKYMRQLAVLKTIASEFSQRGTPYLVFKGAPMAQALYPEPSWRHSGDIDILISRKTLVAARAALKSASFESIDNLFDLPAPLMKVAVNSVRDFAFFDHASSAKLELHTRLIFSKRISEGCTNIDDTFDLRLPQAGAFAAPPVGPVLAFYLLLHGAVSGWARLKWLADLVPLLAKLSEDQRRTIADCAERTRTAAAVKAGLILLQTTFASCQLGSLDKWLTESSGADAVYRRLGRYVDWLASEDDSAANPLRNRVDSLKSAVLLNDRPLDQVRLLPSAAVSSGIRWVSRLTAGDARMPSPT